MIGRIEQRPLLPLELRGGAHTHSGLVQAPPRRVRKERVLRMELRKLPLHQPAHEHHRQHPLPRFVGRKHVDHVATPVARPQAPRFSRSTDCTARQNGSMGISRSDGSACAASSSAWSNRSSTCAWPRSSSAASWRPGPAGIGSTAGRNRWRRSRKRAAQSRGVHGERAPFLQRRQPVQLVQQPLGARQRVDLRRHQQRPQFAQSRIGHLPADLEIEVVHGRAGGEARRQAQHLQRARVVPSAEHGLHRAAQVARHRVFLQPRLEVEMRRDSEPRQGRAQHRDVSVRRASPRCPFRGTPAPRPPDPVSAARSPRFPARSPGPPPGSPPAPAVLGWRAPRGIPWPPAVRGFRPATRRPSASG